MNEFLDSYLVARNGQTGSITLKKCNKKDTTRKYELKYNFKENIALILNKMKKTLTLVGIETKLQLNSSL